MEVIGKTQSNYDKEKSMKIIKIIIVILLILLVFSVVLLSVIAYMQSKEFKIIIDDQTNKQIPADAFIIENNQITYVSIKDLAPYLGDYKYNNGKYREYSEEKTSCYLQNEYETVTYSLNSSTIYKSELEVSNSMIDNESGVQNANNDISYEYFEIDEPVKMINNKLYTTKEGISIGCNIDISYDTTNNSVQIYTLPALVQYYTNVIKGAAISDEDTLFSNQKAVLYDLVVVKDEKGLYGVKDTSGQEVIGNKYNFIQFLESTQEFIVRTSDRKYGIISKEGSTKIRPEYDSIKQIDKEGGLYVVSNNNKYGVINKNGKLIIYLEYDQIGIDASQFSGDNIKNNYILYDNCIPVKRGDKWGLIDKTGNSILEPQYDSFGCVISTSINKTANNILLIPEYEGIIVCQDKLYGIINSTGTVLIPIAATNVYSITSSGENSYYLTYNKETIDVIRYLKENGIFPINENTGIVTRNDNNSTDSDVNYNSENQQSQQNTEETQQLQQQQVQEQQDQEQQIQQQVQEQENQYQQIQEFDRIPQIQL